MQTDHATSVCYSSRAEWLAARPSSLGASEFAAALGVDPYTSPFVLYHRKRGTFAEPDIGERLAVKIGNVMEPFLVDLYGEQTSRVVEHNRLTTFASKEYPFLTATPDGFALDAERPGFGVVETKTTGEFNRKAWADGDPPIHQQVQLQGQLFVLGLDWGSLAGLVGNREFHHVDIERHEKLLAGMIPKLAEFWARVQSGDPPPLDGSPSTIRTLKALHPRDNGETVEADARIAGLWAKRALLKGSVAAAEKEIDAAEAEIRAAFGDATFLRAPGLSLSYKTQTRRGCARVGTDLIGALERAGIAHKIEASTDYRVLREVKGDQNG